MGAGSAHRAARGRLVPLADEPTACSDDLGGLALISGDTVEQVVLNEGTQQVNLTLTENYVHQSTGGDDRTIDLGKRVYFTYSYVQTKDILDTVADKHPPRGGTRCARSPVPSARSFSC